MRLLCVICGDEVPQARIDQWPHVKTCSPPCSSRNHRNSTRRATHRYMKKRRAEDRAAREAADVARLPD